MYEEDNERYDDYSQEEKEEAQREIDAMNEEPEVVWEGYYIRVFSDDTMEINDGIGYIGSEETVELFRKIRRNAIKQCINEVSEKIVMQKELNIENDYKLEGLNLALSSLMDVFLSLNEE